MKKTYKNSIFLGAILALISSIFTISYISFGYNTNEHAVEVTAALAEKPAVEEEIAQIPEITEEQEELIEAVIDRVEEPKQEQKPAPKEEKKEEPKQEQPVVENTNNNNETVPEVTTTNNNQYNGEIGKISLSGSDFSRDLVKDDGSYFYLDHSLSGKLDHIGVPFIDFRTDFTGKKTLIYAHSSKTLDAPFNILQKYHNNKAFYDAHKYIYVTYGGTTYTYEIFSVYVSVAENDNDEGLEYFRNVYYYESAWEERIQYYKNNSEYDTGVEVSGNDKILILQTCSMDNNYHGKHYRANQLIMGKLINLQQ